MVGFRGSKGLWKPVLAGDREDGIDIGKDARLAAIDQREAGMEGQVGPDSIGRGDDRQREILRPQYRLPELGAELAREQEEFDRQAALLANVKCETLEELKYKVSISNNSYKILSSAINDLVRLAGVEMMPLIVITDMQKAGEYLNRKRR